MDAIAKELSEHCDLPLHGLQLWVGSHYTGNGIVFSGDWIAPNERTPEDSEKLKKLEMRLESIGILKAEKAELDVLCSAAYLEYPIEPPLMAKRPPPPDWKRNKGSELVCLVDELNEKYPAPMRKPKQVESKKRRRQTRSKPYPGQVDRKSRCVLSSWSLVLGS